MRIAKMKTYNVELKEPLIYKVKIEAENGNEAILIALRRYLEGDLIPYDEERELPKVSIEFCNEMMEVHPKTVRQMRDNIYSGK